MFQRIADLCEVKSRNTKSDQIVLKHSSLRRYMSQLLAIVYVIRCTELEDIFMAMATVQNGYAPVNGLEMYYEVHGSGEPLVLIHGGFGMTGMWSEILPQLAETQQVIAVDLQTHGRTADIDRPFGWDQFADDVAALVAHLGLERVNLMGYSLGGGVALRTAIKHPQLIKKLVLVSAPFKHDGWFAEVRAGMSQVNAVAAEYMKESPMYQAYVSVAPRPEDFSVLADRTGALISQDYDWTDEVAALKMPTLLIYGDVDSIPPSHAAEFFGLLGGGKADAGWDNSNMPASRLAILPATTHYNSFSSPALVPAVVPFLDAPMPEARSS